MRAVCPLSIQRTKTCGLPSLFEMKARRVPSGDQRGERWLSPSERSGRCAERPPSASTIHRLATGRSFITS